MQPNLIKSTASSARQLTEWHGRGTPEAFLLAWVAWEGLKVRLLVAGLAAMGWQVKDIYPEMAKVNIYVPGNYRLVFRAIFGTLPNNTKGVGRVWTAIEDAEAMRHRYVHGVRGAAPVRLANATNLILHHVEDASWAADLKVRANGETRALGNPYARLATPKRKHRPRSELRELLREAAGKR